MDRIKKLKIKKLKIDKAVDSCPIVDPKPFPPFTHDTSNLNYHKDFFKFWCQKVQPLVYDDSLSYYEVLCKVAFELNEVIEHLNTLTDEQKAFIEKVTALVNQLITEWNELVDWWECVLQQWESMVNQFNQWDNKFNDWENTFNQWREEFENLKNEWNNVKNEWNNMKNQWENFKNEILQKIEELENSLGDTIINLNSVPIVKNTRINFNVPTTQTNTLSLDIRDLIYPEVTIRFMSMIGGIENISYTTKKVQGGLKVYELTVKSMSTDDENFPWMGEQLSNPAIGAGTISINNLLCPCVVPTIPIKPDKNSKYDLVIPDTMGIAENTQITGKYYVYEGGKTILYKTTKGFFGGGEHV